MAPVGPDGLVAMALCLLLLSAGCGFRPVHGTPEPGARPTTGVAIIPAPEREGQLLTQALDRQLNPGAAPAPTMALSATVSVSVRDLFQQRDTNVTRSEVVGTAAFNLRSIQDNRVVLSGSERAAAPYERPPTTEGFFAETTARRDARERVISEIADRIARRVQMFLSRPADERIDGSTPAASAPAANPSGPGRAGGTAPAGPTSPR